MAQSAVSQPMIGQLDTADLKIHIDKNLKCPIVELRADIAVLKEDLADSIESVNWTLRRDAICLMHDMVAWIRTQSPCLNGAFTLLSLTTSRGDVFDDHSDATLAAAAQLDISPELLEDLWGMNNYASKRFWSTDDLALLLARARCKRGSLPSNYEEAADYVFVQFELLLMQRQLSSGSSGSHSKPPFCCVSSPDEALPRSSSISNSGYK